MPTCLQERLPLRNRMRTALRKMEDGGEMFIDFGNGVEHPVAINEEQQEENDDTFFYLE